MAELLVLHALLLPQLVFTHWPPLFPFPASLSAQSCTHEVKFYRGDSDMMDRRTGKLSKQKINVIDTIGMYVRMSTMKPKLF